MIIVIDGYNVLKQLVGAHAGGSKERNRFIAQLSSYATYKKHVLCVVFDGGPHEWSFSERIASIHVVYSGARQTADEYICSYIELHKHAEMVLVTSDNELNRYASDLGVPSIDSSLFYAIVGDTLHARPQGSEISSSMKSAAHNKKWHGDSIKLHDDTSAEFDAYMEEASQIIVIKPVDARIAKIELARNKVARNDRHLLKIFKKL